MITKRFGCDWLQRVRNIVSSGAIGWIIYDDLDTEDLPPLDTPNISIPVFHIGNRDGAAVLDQLKASGGVASATLHPRNLTASISGTYTVDSAGNLRGVNLNLVVSTQFDTVFTGTITTPQGATNLSPESAAGGINLMVPRTWSRPMPFRSRSHSGTAGRSGKPTLP